MEIVINRRAFDPATQLRRFTKRQQGGAVKDCGAIVSFAGHVRECGTRDKKITAMTLEHYPQMGIGQLRAIIAEARRRWPIKDVLVRHRFGVLRPGEAIVFIAVAGCHRRPVFEACEFLIDWLKVKAPFWKYEQTPTGGDWVEASAGDAMAAQRWTGVKASAGDGKKHRPNDRGNKEEKT